MSSKSDTIKASLWEMANKLRGSMDAAEYKNYILAFLFYKYLSNKQEKYLTEEAELITPEEGETFDEVYAREAEGEIDDYLEDITGHLGYAILPQYTWTRLVDKIENSEIIASDYQCLFDSFNENAMLNQDASKDFRGVFSDVNLGDSRLGSSTVERAKSLNQIVKLVDEVEFKDEDGKDILGDIYEYLIGQFAASAGKKSGEFYTPHEVSKILAGIVTTGREEAETKFTVFDPTCGSGSLLLTVGSALPGGKRPGAIKYYGQEKNTTTYNLCRMNLMMHDVDFRNMVIRNADTLGPDWPNGIVAGKDDPLVSFDAVVANPPYSGKWDAAESYMKDNRFKDYGKLAPKSKADFAFVLDGLYHLGPEGTMAIVLPHGVLFRGAAEGVIRQTLIEKGQIDAVIGLPSNLFYGTSIPTIVLVLKKNKPNKDIFFIDASNYFTKAKAKNVLTDEDIDRILTAYRERKDIDKFARNVSIDEIRENDFNLNIPRYVDTAEKEEEIDLDALFQEMKETDLQIEEVEKQITDQLKLLGVLR